MGMTRIDAVWACIFVLAIMATVLAFLTVRGPAVDVRDITIHEIPTPPAAGQHI
jgi:hypothetical protein